MKRKFKEIIYSQLREAQEKYGGYTGNDIVIISRKINRQPKTKGINVSEKYFIENARASIQTPFSFRDLKNISIADLEGIIERLKECERWLEGNYTGIGNPIRHYDRIKKRKHT